MGLYNSRETTEQSWIVPASKLIEDYDLSAKNPAKQKEAEHLAPTDILKQIRAKEKRVSGLLDEIESLLVEK